MSIKILIKIATSLLMLASVSAYAEPLNVKLGLWRFERKEKAGKIKHTCITQGSLAQPTRNVLLSCTQQLLPTSNSTSAEWEMTCANNRKVKWKMTAISQDTIEGYKTPINAIDSKNYKLASVTKWISADCGTTTAIFPTVN